MRQGQVFYKNELAGLIQETDEGFTFQYDSEYLLNKDGFQCNQMKNPQTEYSIPH